MKKYVLFVLILTVSLLLFGCSEDEALVGAWRSETGSVTHFYRDGTGRTVDDAGEHEFTWEIISLSDTIIMHRYARILDSLRSVYGDEHVNAFGEAGWGEDDFLIFLTFDHVPNPRDFPFYFKD